jgi:DNA-binding SARP family transcriptional activator
MQGTACLNIRVIGTPRIFVGETPLALNHLKSRAILYYLAAAGKSHTCDHLATLTWGESSQSEASHSLRSSLYYLRKALQTLGVDDALVSNGELLTLDSAFYEEILRQQSSRISPAVPIVSSTIQSNSYSDAGLLL